MSDAVLRADGTGHLAGEGLDARGRVRRQRLPPGRLCWKVLDVVERFGL